ncbi:SAF domain-containing protein [Tessaracoccus sp.]
MTWITRTISWHRRKIAAVLAALGLFALMSHLSGADETASQVVVIRSGVTAGAVISGSDIELASLHGSAVPPDAFTGLTDVVGQSAAVTVSAHTIVQPGLLVPGSAPPSGRSLVPISVNDGQLRAMLTPGMRVALVSAVADSPGIVTEDAVIHPMPQHQDASLMTPGQAALVLVEVPTSLAPEVAVLGQSGQLALFLTG